MRHHLYDRQRIHPLEVFVWNVFGHRSVIDAPILAEALGYEMVPKTPIKAYFTIAQHVLTHMLKAGRLTRDVQGWYIPAIAIFPDARVKRSLSLGA